MSTTIPAIETVYRGYRFRSRLEARWAVFFDALGIHYEYETEGYELPDGTRYLPDFWLPALNVWAEVKPAPLTETEARKCRVLAEQTGHSCIALEGLPADRSYTIYPGVSDGYWNQIVLHQSFHKGRPWYLFGETVAAYDAGPEYRTACIAARQARFEFGESGARR